MPRERRRASRFAIQQLIELGYGKEKFVQTTGVNISSSGVLCRTKPQIDLYTRVFLSLRLPGEEGEEIINCEGIVVRSTEEGDAHLTAISFTSFEPDESEKFIRLLKLHGGQESSAAPSEEKG